MITHSDNLRKKRKSRIRAKIFGTGVRPRLSVFRSNKAIYVQFIDDEKRITILGLSDREVNEKNKISKALALGKILAEEAKKKSIKTIVFDRSGYTYHGRIKALAQGLREGGIQF